MPEVSVVIPSYNHAGYIAEAVNSVLNQSLPDLELIVVDDGSTDRSLEVLAGFSDPRLRVSPQANQGAHAAINRGLREASGRYLSILNSDDAYTPERLEKALAVFNERPEVGLVGSYIEIVNSEGQSLGIKHGYADCPPWLLEVPQRSFRAGSDLRAALLTENYWSTTSNFVFSRTCFERVGEFRPLRYAHDWDFALRVARFAPLVLLPEPLVRYRLHASNTIRENQAAMVFEILWCLAVNLPEHLQDRDFIDRAPQDWWVEELLHSIYAFDSDRVLSVMLLQRLHENPMAALHMLEAGNPTREKYLEFIRRRLAEAEANAPKSQTMTSRAVQLFKSRLKSLLPGS